jgi:hypothetical protein
MMRGAGSRKLMDPGKNDADQVNADQVNKAENTEKTASQELSKRVPLLASNSDPYLSRTTTD